MDFEPRIAAVFSLADNDVKSELDTSVDTGRTDVSELFNGPDLLPDNDTDEVDIMSGMNEFVSIGSVKIKDDPDAPPSLIAEGPLANEPVRSPLETFSVGVVTVKEDPDMPPALFIEGSILAQELTKPSPIVPQTDRMLPPILQREEPHKRIFSDAPRRHSSRQKKNKQKRHRKIGPSYIVLTNIEPIMNSTTHISTSLFEQKFKECSNMCKKMYFKRNLHAGKDVFNVKTPSKQKHVFSYLINKAKNRQKMSEQKTLSSSEIKKVIEKHNLKVERNRRVLDRLHRLRVRRTVSRIPNDFSPEPIKPAVLRIPWSGESGTANQSTIEDELTRQHENEIKKRNHKIELESLKQLLEAKRSLNLSLKRSRKTRSEGFENFLRSDVKSSVSGRVRKVNWKLGNDFVVGRKDFTEQKINGVTSALLKRVDSIYKKKNEDIKRNNDNLVLSMKRNTISSAKQSVPSKRANVTDVIIDNAEESIDHERPSKNKRQTKAASDYIDTQTAVRVKDRNTDNLKTKESVKDMVLIQNLPEEENLISGILQDTHDEDKKDEILALPKTFEGRRSMNNEHVNNLYDDNLLLNHSYRNPGTRTTGATPKPMNASINPSKHTKYKAVIIPGDVEKLFSGKEIKKEPLDNCQIKPIMTAPVKSSAKVSDNVQVINVTFPNGVYKQVIINTSPISQNAPATSSRLDNVIPVSLFVNSKTTQSSGKSVTTSASSSSLVKTSNSTSVSRAIMSPISTASGSLQQKNMGQQKNISGQSSSTPLQMAVTTPTQVHPALRTLLPAPTRSYKSCGILSASKLVADNTSSKNIATLERLALTPTVTPISRPNHSYSSRQSSVFTTCGNDTNIGEKLTASEVMDKISHENKFYLLIINGKNILVPVSINDAQSNANIVTTETTALGSTQPRITSPTENNPKILGGRRNSKDICLTTSKGTSGIFATRESPTMSVEANAKPANNLGLNRSTAAINKAVTIQTETIPKTFTVTNVGLINNADGAADIGHANVSNDETIKERDSESTTQNKKTNIPLTIPYTVTQTVCPPASVNEHMYASNALKNISEAQMHAQSIVFDHNNEPVGLLSDLLNGVIAPSAKALTSSNNKDDEDSCRVTDGPHIDNPTSIKSSVVDGNKKSDNFETNRHPFTETMTAREERLRRLKELVREKKRAVEEIRGNTAKNE